MKNGVSVAVLRGTQPQDGFGGDATIGIGLVRDIGGFERGTAGQRVHAAGGSRDVLEHRFLAGEFSVRFRGGIGVFDDLFLEMRDRERSRIPKVAVADVIDLAERFGAVSGLREMLRQSDGVRPFLPQFVAEFIQAGGGRVRAEHQREPRRRADRLVAVGEIETHPAGGQRVDVWRPGGGVSVTAESRFEIVHEDDKDVGTTGGGMNLRRGQRCCGDEQ